MEGSLTYTDNGVRSTFQKSAGGNHDISRSSQRGFASKCVKWRNGGMGHLGGLQILGANFFSVDSSTFLLQC